MNSSPAWVVVPVKRFAEAKARLANCIGPAEREALSRAMLNDVLHAAGMTPGVDGVLVVSNEPSLAALKRQHGFEWLRESPGAGLNAALDDAVGVLAKRGVHTCCILHSDLPLARPESIARLLAAHRSVQTVPAVTLVPDREDYGTNALACSPPAAMPFAFGGGSFIVQRDAAEAAGLSVTVFRADSLALDIDTVEDLQSLRRHYRQYGRDYEPAPPTTTSALDALAGLPDDRVEAAWPQRTA